MITRTDINGDITALKAALETLVPDFFASVEYDDAESPTTVICKDSDGNTIFTAAYTAGGSATYTAYKNATTSVACSSTHATARPLYFYKVGNNSAAIQCPNYHFVWISKTNTAVVGFVIPDTFATGNTNHYAKNNVACWGDDPALDSPLTITGGTSSEMEGNHTQFVQIPLHGTYNENIYLPKAFFFPMVQEGMRGVVQELTTDDGTYLTNGYIALLDD